METSVSLRERLSSAPADDDWRLLDRVSSVSWQDQGTP